jgi:hypothetical protein
MTIGRRSLLSMTLALVVALAMGLASGAQAGFYLGHGHGIRVAIRVEGSKVIAANFFVRLYCLGPHGSRHLNRANLGYASPQAPLKLDRDGTFRQETPEGAQEAGLRVEDELVGHVGGGAVTGSFRYELAITRKSGRTICQTGSYPFDDARLPFRAPLR